MATGVAASRRDGRGWAHLAHLAHQKSYILGVSLERCVYVYESWFVQVLVFGCLVGKRLKGRCHRCATVTRDVGNQAKSVLVSHDPRSDPKHRRCYLFMSFIHFMYIIFLSSETTAMAALPSTRGHRGIAGNHRISRYEQRKRKARGISVND
ncbi:hypothetical protein Sjap_023433 [Stephania japonica]|uniref:Uncharacterized protein n=1 Tax=Stephania japonica TaxID=461633 RepID=A0AAP0HMZ3_9MAGN